MTVSVIIPLHNGRGVIGACLNSICDVSSDRVLEVIVIDDCSTDGSLELVKQSNYHLILLANQMNRGYAYSINLGIARAHGEYLLLLNQDTILKKDAIAKLCEAMRAEEGIGLVAPRLTNPDGSLQKSVRRFPLHSDIIYYHFGLAGLLPDSARFNRWKMCDFNHLEKRLVEQPAFSAVLIRAEVFAQVGLLDPGFPLFFNDVDFCRRAIAAGWKILFFPEAEVTHVRGQATAQQRIRSIYLSHAAFIRYLCKYYRGARYSIPNFICSFMLVCSAHIRALYYLGRRLFTSKA